MFKGDLKSEIVKRQPVWIKATTFGQILTPWDSSSDPKHQYLTICRRDSTTSFSVALSDKCALL